MCTLKQTHMPDSTRLEKPSKVAAVKPAKHGLKRMGKKDIFTRLENFSTLTTLVNVKRIERQPPSILK
jgi:hypothetical protein